MDLNQRLERASKRRDALEIERRHIEGKLEAAEASLAAVEAECRAKGVNPENIDAVIEQLTIKLNDLVLKIETDVASADAALAPFLKESR